MENGTLLLFAIFVPLVGAALVGALAQLGPREARWGALTTTLITLVLAGLLVRDFPTSGSPASDYASIDWPWLAAGNIDVRFALGLSGLSLWLVALSALLMVTAVLVSWEAITDRPALFYALLLILESGCIGVFAARDILLFYVFFEFTLIPLFFLIGIWGSEDRRHAAVKFFLFTLAGSVLTFLGLLAIALWAYRTAPVVVAGAPVLSFSLPSVANALSMHPLPEAWQCWIFLALFAGFAIKVPLFPLHTWLPLAHVQAPTAASVILAGVLLKIGAFGFLQFSIPLLPHATAVAMPWLLGLSAIGIVYGALVALAQQDMKRLIAYSSVSHLGFCMLGLFALNRLGALGGSLQLINHGISTGGLFAVVGMLYERYHTRQIDSFGGLARRLPVLSVFMLLFTLSSIGLPGTNGFSGEFMLLTGMFQRAWIESNTAMRCQWVVISAAAVSGVVLGAWYMLWLVQRVFFGPLKEPAVSSHGDSQPHDHTPVTDLSWREIAALAPLVVCVFWIGLAPKMFFDSMQPGLDRLTAAAEAQAAKMYTTDQATPSVDSLRPEVAQPLTLSRGD